jgi:putative Ca2+/H+ antiporter (TMEM165/GDT1 family)
MAQMHLSQHAYQGFVKSFGVILASEIGDKTFFIAALMAMKHSRVTVFLGAVLALAVMTVLSAAMGWAAPALIPKVYTHYAAAALFIFFGVKTLYDVVKGADKNESEMEEVEQELLHSDAKRNSSSDLKDLKKKPSMATSLLNMIFSRVFINAFTLTFLAEWGDRSQIATIGLAASEDAVGVTLGGILGHMICTGAAVIGGRHLATHINERTIGIMGGVIFLIFGAHAIYEGP